VTVEGFVTFPLDYVARNSSYQAPRRRDVPRQLVVYPGQSHGISVPSYQVDRYRRYLEWYAKWVKGETAPKPIS
jgi:hypothetical protein